MTLFSQMAVDEATAHLLENDPVLASVISLTNPVKARVAAPYFQTLCKITIGQQLSGTVADRIYDKIANLPEMQKGFHPENLLSVERGNLKNCGLSSQKANFLVGFAHILIDNPNAFDELNTLEDEDLIKRLKTIRGIGPWTAAIFSMSALGRLNIFPIGDVTIQKCIEKLYGVHVKTDKVAADKVIERWAPYKSVAVSYLWNWYDQERI